MTQKRKKRKLVKREGMSGQGTNIRAMDVFFTPCIGEGNNPGPPRFGAAMCQLLGFHEIRAEQVFSAFRVRKQCRLAPSRE